MRVYAYIAYICAHSCKCLYMRIYIDIHAQCWHELQNWKNKNSCNGIGIYIYINVRSFPLFYFLFLRIIKYRKARQIVSTTVYKNTHHLVAYLFVFLFTYSHGLEKVP